MFVPGEWRLNIAAGLSAAFSTPLLVPPPIRWNRAGLSPVARTSDLTLRWNTEGYSNREWMAGKIVAGSAGVVYRVPATAGSLTIPAALLARLPASTSNTAVLELFPLTSNLSTFAIPVTNEVEGIGLSTFSYSETIQIELR